MSDDEEKKLVKRPEPKHYMSNMAKSKGAPLQLKNLKGHPVNQMTIAYVHYTQHDVDKGIQGLSCPCGRSTWKRGIWFYPIALDHGRNGFIVHPEAHCRPECAKRSAFNQPNRSMALQLFNMMYALVLDVSSLVTAGERWVLHVKGLKTLEEYHNDIDNGVEKDVKCTGSVRVTLSEVYIHDMSRNRLVPEDEQVGKMSHNVVLVGIQSKNKNVEAKPLGSHAVLSEDEDEDELFASQY